MRKCSAFHFLAQISFSYMETFSLLGLTFPWKSSLLTELYYFEFCYVICSICRRSLLVVFLGVVLLFRYSAALLMFHYSVLFRLFRQCSVVPPAFWCTVNVPMFRRCSVFRSSVFRCSWFNSMSYRFQLLRDWTASLTCVWFIECAILHSLAFMSSATLDTLLDDLPTHLW